MNIILGSQSPRRKDILESLLIPFTQKISQFPEEDVPYEGNPEEYVLKIAMGKADSFPKVNENQVLITVDTIVYCNDKVYGKAGNEEEAFQMLKELCGKWQSVYSAIVVRTANQSFSGVEESKVMLNSLSDEEIRIYHSIIDVSDKAGSYAIQESGGLICKKIQGCYYNVCGLPVNLLQTLLKDAGIKIWDIIQHSSVSSS